MLRYLLTYLLNVKLKDEFNRIAWTLTIGVQIGKISFIEYQLTIISIPNYKDLLFHHSFIYYCSLSFDVFNFRSISVVFSTWFDLSDTIYCNFDIYVILFDVNHMRRSDGTNKAATYLLTYYYTGSETDNGLADWESLARLACHWLENHSSTKVSMLSLWSMHFSHHPYSTIDFISKRFFKLGRLPSFSS